MEDIKLLNLEDTVGYLVDRAELASIGATLKGRVDNYNSLPTGTVGDVYAVGTATPYSYYAYIGDKWLDIGTWPLAGPKGVPGDRGPQGPAGPIGPKGDKGNQGIAGPAGDSLGVNYVTDLVLSKGSSTSVSYNESTGAALAKQGQIIVAGNTYDITVTDKIPIIPGDNIDIYTNGTNSALKIGAKVPVTSVNGQKGDVRLTIPTSTSQLVNDAEFITAEYHDNTKQDTLVSGQNIKTINNQSILGPGNITISGGGGGSGTDTGFDNVRQIQAADEHTTYNPDTGEYVITSGNADIFYKDGTKTTIPYVQTIGLMAGDNITITEELIDNANWRLKINATGGGSASDGFNNLQELILSPSTYVNNTPAGDFYFEGNGTFRLKGSSSATGIESIKIQLPVVPGDGILFDKTTDGSCEIKAADYKPAITLETHTASQFTSHYGRIYYTFDVGSTTANDIANGKYNVTIYDETGGGGYYYCPLQGENMTFLGEEVPNGAGGPPSSIVGWSFKAKESETVVSFWRDSLSLGGGGGGGGSTTLYQHTLTYSSDKFSDTDQFSGEGVSGSFGISFYSTHGHFENASDFWTWLIGRGSINVCDGQLWGSMGGDVAFSRITVLGTTDAEKYIQFETYGGYGEWNPLEHFLKNPESTGLTDTIIDGFRDM